MNHDFKVGDRVRRKPTPAYRCKKYEEIQGTIIGFRNTDPFVARVKWDTAHQPEPWGVTRLIKVNP